MVSTTNKFQIQRSQMDIVSLLTVRHVGNKISTKKKPSADFCLWKFYVPGLFVPLIPLGRTDDDDSSSTKRPPTILITSSLYLSFRRLDLSRWFLSFRCRWGPHANVESLTTTAGRINLGFFLLRLARGNGISLPFRRHFSLLHRHFLTTLEHH